MIVDLNIVKVVKECENINSFMFFWGNQEVKIILGYTLKGEYLFSSTSLYVLELYLIILAQVHDKITNKKSCPKVQVW